MLILRWNKYLRGKDVTDDNKWSIANESTPSISAKILIPRTSQNKIDNNKLLTTRKSNKTVM